MYQKLNDTVKSKKILSIGIRIMLYNANSVT